MPDSITVGQLLVNDELPPELRDYQRVMTGAELDRILTVIGRADPDGYRKVSHGLMQLGRKAAYESGVTINLQDLTPVPERQAILDFVEAQEKQIFSGSLTPAERQTALTELYDSSNKLMVDKVYQTLAERQHPMAMQVQTKARGSPMQLAAMMASPGAFEDGRGRKIPIYSRHSYAEGLTPAEWFGATFGARKAVLSTKLAVPRGGDLGKQLAVASEGLIVTEEDCGTTNGIPVDVSDRDSVGALLARSTVGFDANAAVDSKMLDTLKQKKLAKLLVRSPITCQSRTGVCQHCVGRREDGQLPRVGTAIGLQAASALAERIAQGSLNVKHGGGQSIKGPGERVYGGFDIINQLGQVPETFRHKAILADKDGKVNRIEPAPQGGTYVYVDDQPHWVEAEQAATVKIGDQVDTGDQLSTGIVNPAEVVRYKGLGEGRRYFAERLTQAYRDSKLTAHRRNAEIIARSVVDHVETTDEAGDYLPGDVVRYSAIAATYRPRPGAVSGNPEQFVGQYLEQPVLHHTIGTKLSKRIAAELKQFGVDKVMAHADPPPFQASMVRLRAVPHYDEDWMAKLHGSYLMENLLADVHRGAESQIHGTNPIPGIAYGLELGKPKGGETTY